MPTIKLKPKSADFIDRQSQADIKHVCDMPDCNNEAGFRAPKSRKLNEYYNFCQGCASEYNKAWNYFDGMSDTEIQQHIYNSIYGERPTWKFGDPGFSKTQDATDKAWKFYNGFDENETKEQPKRQIKGKEGEALLILGIEPPTTLEDVKLKYKELVKKYHPDHNKNNKDAEDIVKNINMAYTILKAAYAEYEIIENKDT